MNAIPAFDGCGCCCCGCRHALWNSADGNAQNRPWGEDYIPNLTVTTQHGKPVKFYDDLVKGKIVIMSFIYTSCTDICPLTTARMAQLEEKLGDMVGREVFILSMTVDPERDTPERLKEYAEVSGRPRMVIRDRKAGGHPRHQLQIRRAQQAVERAPQ